MSACYFCAKREPFCVYVGMISLLNSEERAILLGRYVSVAECKQEPFCDVGMFSWLNVHESHSVMSAFVLCETAHDQEYPTSSAPPPAHTCAPCSLACPSSVDDTPTTHDPIPQPRAPRPPAPSSAVCCSSFDDGPKTRRQHRHHANATAQRSARASARARGGSV